MFTGAKSDGEVGQLSLDDANSINNERRCTSDSELSRSPHSIPSSGSELSSNTGGGWIMVRHSLEL